MKITSGNKYDVSNLSPHLFWDVDRGNIDFIKNKKFIIQRVLEYGLLSDWQLIYSYYGIEEIAQIAITLKDLDKKTLAFIALLSDVPKEKFLCYTSMQSTPQHWNF
jgi:hypothetical protein